ncbi:MAG: ArsR family transcriptional regulator [Longimicrobiales bacterium]
MASQPPILDRLIGGTRQEVLELLLRSDRTVQEIADVVGVSANAIRGHLAALERDGLVVQRATRRDTGGKPAAVYALSREADELFPKAYAFVLQGLLGVLDEREGADAVRDVLLEVGTRAATPAEGSERERVDAAAEALRTLGATVEITRKNGHWRIQGFSCPLSAVTARDARVCGLAQALVETTTGGRVAEVCDRGPRARCAFTISFSDESES